MGGDEKSLPPIIVHYNYTLSLRKPLKSKKHYAKIHLNKSATANNERRTIV